MRRLVLLAILFTGPLAAQEDVYVIRSSPAWLGISYDVRWVQDGNSCSPQVLVEAVVHGSPAERAGLRAGDAIIAVNGEAVPPGRLQTLASNLAPGDSVQLRFQRDGSTRVVTAIADRRPERPLDVFVEPTIVWSRGVTPVIEVTGDTLIASNVGAEWEPARIRSYVVRRDDGGVEYRTLDSWSRSELDRRVADLLECADSAAPHLPDWGPERGVRVSLQRLQQRADSLRIVINQRALQRGAVVGRMTRTDSLAEESLRGLLYRRLEPDEAGGVWRVLPGSESGEVTVRVPTAQAPTFRIEEHVAVGLRGVAGAELTALEPELAAYFRNADQGLLVLRIAPGTPADRAGLRPGDVVVAAGGRRVDSVAELRQVIAQPQAQGIDLRVVRHGRTRDLRLHRE